MKSKCIISLCCIFLLTGCWNYRELNQLAIATSIAVDITESGEYEVSVLISNAKKTQVSTKEGESQTIVYSDTGKTIAEAIRNINLKIPKDIYIGHLSVIVIHEDIAKEGMYPILDYFLREPESVKRFFLIIARNTKASNIVATLSPLESFPSQNIYYNIKTSSDSQAISPNITYSKFIEMILKPGLEPILPSIIIEGEPEDAQNSDSLQNSKPEANLKLSTVAIFREDKLVGYADEDDSRGINLIDGKVDNTTTTFKYNDHYLTINLAGIHVKTSVEVVNNAIIANIHLTSSASIREFSGIEHLDTIDTIKDIEMATEENIKGIMQQGVDCAQAKYQSDVFGFGNLLYKTNPKFYQSLNKNWSTDVFPNIQVNITVDIDLQTKGSLEETIGGLKNEITN